MTLGLWLRLFLSGNALCEGGPFDGEVRDRQYRRITISATGHEDEWFDPYNNGRGEPTPFDVGCYERDGIRFVWRDSDGGQQNVERREKVRRYIEVNRIIRETVA